MAFRRTMPVAGALTLLGAVLGSLLSTSAPASADAGVEAAVMSKIRANRSGGPILHSGLLAVARQHSMYMSRDGHMSHDNADSRIRNAPPDPYESNGAPDDGQPPAAWCENVTYSTGHPASEVPGRIYSQWAGSGAHARCMRDTARNVGAVGVYYDGTTWWATFIATVDNTPPGGTQPKASAAPKPEPEEEAAPAPASTQAPSAQTPGEPVPAEQTSADAVAPRISALPDGADAAEDAAEEAGLIPSLHIEALPEQPDVGSTLDVPFAPASDTPPGYGWQEVAAVAAVLSLATSLLRRRLRAAAPVYVPREWSEPPAQRELVGAGMR
jgi:pyruvate/2-oxoglutarate dehydrogenase complex dihydrolipoamide acyltransferase (E2) component